MPQATDELRAVIFKLFGDEIDDGGPLAFLLSHGFTDVKGVIFPPTPAHNVSVDEMNCIEFLFQEWDYDYAAGTKP